MVGVFYMKIEYKLRGSKYKKLNKKEFKNMIKFYYSLDVVIMQIKLLYTEKAINNFLIKNPDIIEYFI